MCFHCLGLLNVEFRVPQTLRPKPSARLLCKATGRFSGSVVLHVDTSTTDGVNSAKGKIIRERTCNT